MSAVPTTQLTCDGYLGWVAGQPGKHEFFKEVRRRRFLAFLASSAAAPLLAQTPSTATSATHMSASGAAFIATLTESNRRRAQLAFEAPERTRWRYTPGSRAGLTLGEMNAAERAAVKALLAAALSRAGQEKVTNIIELELVLREIRAGFPDTVLDVQGPLVMLSAPLPYLALLPGPKALRLYGGFGGSEAGRTARAEAMMKIASKAPPPFASVIVLTDARLVDPVFRGLVQAAHAWAHS